MLVAKLKEHYPLLLVIIFALVLRLLFLDRFGFWDGEIHTIFHSARPLDEFLVGFRDYAAHPPFWFFLTHFILESEPTVWLLRFPSVIFGVVSIIAGYELIKRYIAPNWALVAVWLLCIMPLSLRWSQSARMYAAFLLFSTLSYIYTLDILQPEKKFAWIGFSVVSLLNLYTHYFALFPLFIEAFFLLAVFFTPSISQWWPKRLGRNQPSNKDSAEGATQKPKLVLRRLFFSSITILFGYGWWAWLVLRHNFIDRQIIREARDSAINSYVDYSKLAEDIFGGFNEWFIWLIIGLVIIGSVYLFSSERKDTSIYLAAMIIVIPLVIVLIVSPRRFHGRYFIFMLPYLSMFMIAGILAIKDQFIQLAKSFKLNEIVVGPSIAAILLLLSYQYLAVDILYFSGEEDFFFETRTDSENWHRRGLWEEWQNEMQGPSLMMVGKEYSSVLKQLAVMAYSLQDFQKNSFGTDWSAVDEFDLWTIYPKFNREIKIDLPNSACDVPLIEQVIEGPNQRFVRSRLSISSIQSLLAVDDFELALKLPRNKKFELVVSPSVEGDYSLKINNLPSPASGNVSLRSQLFAVEPSTILMTSVSVLNPVLLFHSTAPELSLQFFDANGEGILSNCSIFQSNLPYDEFGPGEWKVLYLQTIVPMEARQVAIMLSIPKNLDLRNTIYIDNININSISWEVSTK